MRYPRTKKRLQELAGINEDNAQKFRQPVAQELSQLQRIGVISASTDAVERTMNGEFDHVLRDAFSIRDAVDTIVDLIGMR